MIAYILVTAPIKDNMTELWLNSCPICNISSWFFISFTSYTWSLAAVQIYLAGVFNGKLKPVYKGVICAS